MTDQPADNPHSHRLDQTPSITGQKRFKLICCEIIYREASLLAARSPHLVDVLALPKRLHDLGAEKMRQRLQDEITAVPQEDYDAILLGYARCNDGVVGVTAGTIPLIIPRAHDCITLLFGSVQAYNDYSAHSPGTFFRSTGWLERDDGASEDSVMAQLGLDKTYQQYVQQYGEENAKYIIESMGGWQKNYKYLAYIEMGLPQDARYAELTRTEAEQKSLEFRLLKGDLSLLRKVVDGRWDVDDVLVVAPGQCIRADDDGAILAAEPTA